MPGSPSRGRFVWYDLMTPDPEGATAFYTKVIGWTLTEWEGAEEGARERIEKESEELDDLYSGMD